MSDRFRLLVIDGDTVTDRVEVIVCATADFSAFDEALDQQLLVHQQVDHDGIHVVFLEQLRQRLRLCYRTGLTVEDRSLAAFRKVGDVVLDHTVHHVVGH